METLQLIALIRDISLIVASGVLTLVFLLTGILVLRLYGPIRRIIQTVEQTSGLVPSLMSEPLKIINATMELISRTVGIIRGLRRERRDEEYEPG